jgi:hypothetical protein
MKVDIRDIIKKEKLMRELPKNHRNIFEEKLNKEMNTKPLSSYRFLKIAASIMLIFSLGYYVAINQNQTKIIEQTSKPVSLGEISPELKKVEDYYLTHINYQISKIRITDENRVLLDAYFVELGKLQEDYSNSISEIDPDEVSEETINALINNLQMRLKLMYQLKAQLKKIDNLNKEENESNKA